MATSLSEEVKKEIECKICLQVMTKPKVLDCLHTFCEGCIEDIRRKIAKKNDISCPVCRNVTVLPPGGVRSLRANFLVNTLQDALGKSAKVIKCEYCDEKCSYTCLDCKDKMCFTHGSSHCNTKYTRGHRVVSMKAVTAGKYAKEILASQVIDCEVHTGKCIEFYCMKCEKMLCVSCKILDHEGHQCTSVEKAGSSKMTTIKTTLSEMGDLSQVLHEFKSELKKAQTCLINDGGHISATIDGIADKMCAEIRRQQAQLKHELDSHIKTQSKIYKSEKEEIEMNIASISSGIEFGNTILKHGRPIDAITHSHQIQQNVTGTVSNFKKRSAEIQGTFGQTQYRHPIYMQAQEPMPKRQKCSTLRKSGIFLQFEENFQITNPILGSKRGGHNDGTRYGYYTTYPGTSQLNGQTQKFGTIRKKDKTVECIIFK